MFCFIIHPVVAVLSINKQKPLALNTFCYSEAGARRNEREKLRVQQQTFGGAQERTSLSYYLKVPKSVGPAKALPGRL
jgi:hypothetical protein